MRDPQIPESDLTDDSQLVDEVPSEQTDYPGPIPHDAQAAA